MASCCGAPRCTCAVTAGPGVTVDGNGSPTTPYVISAGTATPTPVQAGDTNTVDTTVAGTGTPADPYVVSADVILDPAPPGGGTNLLAAGPGGLSLECDDVRTCFSAGDGATYDPATGEIGAKLSADAGNVTTFGADGGLFTPAPAAAAPTVVQAQDSPTVDVSVSGTGTSADPYEVSAAVVLDPAPPGGGTNLLGAGPGGLSLECDDVRTCFSAGDGAAYDPATGVITARLSADAGNAVGFGTDGGLFAPPASGGGTTALAVTDSSTVDLTLSGTGTTADPYDVTAAVKLDPAPPGGGTNLLSASANGLHLECDDVRGCFSATGPATYDPATGTFGVEFSADAGNATTIGTDGGIFTPAGAATALQAGDTNTVDTTVSGAGTAASPFVVMADVIVAPGANGLAKNASGLVVAPSADTGNQLEFGADGKLFVPPDPPLEIGCGLTGAGTAASPLAVAPVGGSRAWATDWACDAPTHSTLHCDPDGTLWTPPEHYSAAESIYVEHFNGGWATPLTPAGGWVIISNGANFQFNYPANFLGNDCRNWTFDACVAATWDINYTSTAVFELGYIYTWGGGAATARPLWGLLTAPGAARRARDNGTWHEFGFNMDPAAPFSLVGWPAVRVQAGSLTINSWITDAAYHTTTQT
ncbi:hypothetical protein VSR01_16215 [Actinacidiphila sp. DG2A-62]|uniref:hypothetical protein n=1 Tax=Actinacidiphila sp. DG2A-62 TaxID=3108821 RepID=UPI002DBE9F33|nr:hypothetical protein [Actinacidiphila sp. DG2A-62]MEC3994990.1 hypothetical protein [Actinacidiphila sp. DG2A-62]